MALVVVGNLVWLDSDRDGIKDVSETGIAVVVLKLTDLSGNPVIDAYGNLVGQVTTDANGNYLFSNLLVGQYKVMVVSPPSGLEPTIQGSGTDLSMDSSTGTATSGNLTTNGATDLTLGFGLVRPMVSVGDYVWYDLNHDGVQDSGEPPLSGVTLTITKQDGSAVVDVFGNTVTTTRTDANGLYSFDNLPPGTYTVTATTPAGFTATVAGAGTGATDSSIGLATSAVLSVDGDRDSTLDFGFWAPPSVVGSLVWVDTNANGLQDVGEPGIAGVTLTLTKPDGSQVTDVNGKVVGPTTTDADGNYLFSNLPLGTAYVVTITYPSGAVPTTTLVGSNGGGDSSTNSATSILMTVDNRVDLSLDFGVIFPPLEPPCVCSTPIVADTPIAANSPQPVVPAVATAPQPVVLTVPVSKPHVAHQQSRVSSGEEAWLHPRKLSTPSIGAKWVNSKIKLWDTSKGAWKDFVSTEQGTWSIIRGVARFVPAQDFLGVASIRFKMTDTARASAQAKLTVTIVDQLPRTGGRTTEWIWSALMMLFVGIGLMLISHRTRCAE